MNPSRGDRHPAFGHSLIGVRVGDRRVALDGRLACRGSDVTRLACATLDELAELLVPILHHLSRMYVYRPNLYGVSGWVPQAGSSSPPSKVTWWRPVPSALAV